MKKLLITLLLIVSTITTLGAKDLDVDALVKKAQAQNKQLMFFFHIPRCPYCGRMLKENFKDPVILKEIENSLILEDVYTAQEGTVTFKEFKGTRKEFAKHMEAKAYPATIFADENGKIVYKSIGYRNIDEHLIEIKYVNTKSYKTKDLDTFADDLEFENDE